jgi:hypothetical protein
MFSYTFTMLLPATAVLKRPFHEALFLVVYSHRNCFVRNFIVRIRKKYRVFTNLGRKESLHTQKNNEMKGTDLENKSLDGSTSGTQSWNFKELLRNKLRFA